MSPGFSLAGPGQFSGQTVYHLQLPYRYAVAEWYGAGLCDREVAASRVRLPPVAAVLCVPMPNQRAVPQGSVIEYQQKLGSKRAYHVMHQPSTRGLATSAGVWLRATGNETSAALWALEARERTLLLLYYYIHKVVSDNVEIRYSLRPMRSV